MPSSFQIKKVHTNNASNIFGGIISNNTANIFGGIISNNTENIYSGIISNFSINHYQHTQISEKINQRCLENPDIFFGPQNDCGWCGGKGCGHC